MSSSKQQRELMLAQLRKTPIVQIACEKTGVSRTSFYRWRREDKAYAEATDRAILEGVQLVNDMAESQLLAAIRDGNITAIGLWLKHNHARFKTRVEVEAHHHHTQDTLTLEQEAIVKEALRLSLPAKENSDES